MVGILSYGAYVPRLRLQRASAVAATAWFNAALKALAKGERAMANWDEDAITLAVEAARDALDEAGRSRVGRVMLASTSLAFADRLNAGVVKEALNLPDSVTAADLTGSQRAGVSALVMAAEAVKGGAPATLCIAAERRPALPGSEAELRHGDAAAAFLVGEGDTFADLVATHSATVDFVDHHRAAGRGHDYEGESRWVRDEGFLKIVPPVVRLALEKAEVDPTEVRHLLVGAPQPGLDQALARASGISADAVAPSLQDRLGDAGCAHPLVLLAHALETAKPGEVLVVVAFGQGCEVLVFRTTASVGRPAPGLSVSGWLARGAPEANYLKHLCFAGVLALDGGVRAEADIKTELSMLYRHRKSFLGLVGGRCRETGVVQFPRSEISVAQNARAVGTQEDYPLADRRARVLTFTADRLVYDPDPPGCYGMIEFEGGGRLLADFAETPAEGLQVGDPVRMMFRIKRDDRRRGFKHYFWKAVPDYRPAALA